MEIPTPYLRNRCALSFHRRTPAPQFRFIPGSFIVRFTDRPRLREAIPFLEDVGFRIKSLVNFPITKIHPIERPEIIERRLRERFKIEERLQNLLGRIEGVIGVSPLYTKTTFGPHSLDVRPELFPAIRKEEAEKEELSQERLLEDLGVKDVWDEFGERGQGAIVADFDTAFCPDFDNPRVIGTFYGEDVDSAFFAEEHHGSMTLNAAAGAVEDGFPFDGVAPDADIILCRLSNAEGELTYIADAWDWLVSFIKDRGITKPIVTNHSYGVPMCSNPRLGRDEEAMMIAEILKDPQITGVYAAGNNAHRCMHRLAGETNGICGMNARPEVFTIGAQRMIDGRIQSYSSHGFGDVSPVKHPKPDVTIPIPNVTTYGCSVKDMSYGPLGEGSSGGTSHATPLVSGVLALMRSMYPGADDPLLRRVLYRTSTFPRATQINALLGHDARFGWGSVKPYDAVDQISLLKPI